MKTLTNLKSTITLMSVLVATMLFFGCSKENDVEKPMYLPSSNSTSKVLSPGEKEGLIYLAEQEKMLRDVYTCVAEKTQLAVMTDFATAKGQHMLLIGSMIDKYDLDNPLNGRTAGEYQNPVLQKKYDNLNVCLPSTEPEAIELAGDLEASLITDLQYYLSGVEGNPDLVSMYNKIIVDTQNSSNILYGGFPGYQHIWKPDKTILEF